MTGSGTQADPYIIYNVADLQDVNNDLDAYYELASDIDASATISWNGGSGFIPLGNFSPTDFQGHLDGRGYTISDLFMDWDTPNVGLFSGLSSGAEVKNVNLVDVDITGSGGRVGGLAAWNYGTIENCSVTGTVSAGSKEEIGGLVGYNNGGTISKCYSQASVSGSKKTGGLVGRLESGTVSDSYATGSVTGTDKPGGLISEMSDDVYRCYSTGYVTGTGKGGLIGDKKAGTCSYSYWDTQTSGCSSSDGGTGKTTVEMKQQATFETWDFITVWGIVEDVSYPFLRCFIKTHTRTLTVDTLLQFISTKALVIDGLLRQTDTKAVSVDALLRKSSTKEVTTDSKIIERNSKALTADAYLRKTFVKQLAVDTVVVERLVKTASIDGFLRATVTKQITTNALTKAAFSRQVTVDGLLEQVGTKTLTANALLQVTSSAAITANATIVIRYTKTLSSDALVRPAASKQLVVDAYLRKTGTKAVIADGLVELGGVKAITVDALLRQTITKTFVADAFVRKTGVKALGADAILEAFTCTSYGIPFRYDAANWHSEIKFYFEVYMRASSGTVYAILYNKTEQVKVTTSQVSTSSPEFQRLRSPELTLIDGKTYRAQFCKAAANTGEFLGAQLIAI